MHWWPLTVTAAAATQAPPGWLDILTLHGGSRLRAQGLREAIRLDITQINFYTGMPRVALVVLETRLYSRK